MRTPSEYIAAAARNIRANLMRDCAAVLTHGRYCSEVTRVSSPRRGEEEVSEAGASEAIRVLAPASDLCGVEKGDAAWLDEDLRIVTSVRTDPSGAVVFVGLSDPLTRYTASWTGSRPGRAISATVPVMAKNNGLMTEYADGYAPVQVPSWAVLVPFDAWNSTEPPHIGDELRFGDERLRISRVDRRDEYFFCQARGR